MKRVIVMILTLSLIIVSSYTVFASMKTDGIKEDDLRKEYQRIVEFDMEIKELFPEIERDDIISYDEFVELKEENNTVNESFCDEILSCYEKDIDGNTHTLYIYADGSVSMVSVVRDSIFSGQSGVDESSTPIRMYWKWQNGTADYHQVYVKLRIYGSAGSYYFDSPSFTGDISSIYTQPFYLYRSGSNNVMVYQGNPYSINIFGEFDPYFGVQLTGTLNVNTGRVTASHSYGAAYSY